MILKLFKLFASNFFSFQGLSEGKTKGPKTVIKNILFILLFVFVIAMFVLYYSVFMFATYKQLELTNETFLMPSVTIFVSLLVIMFFGFTSVASNYYTGSGEEQFLSMPITPTQLFGAKFLTSVVVDGLIGLFLFVIASVIYGFNEGCFTNPLFWVGMLTSGIFLSVISIGLIYLLLILILTFIPALRKRSILTGIASALIVILAVCYSMFSSRISMTFTMTEEALSMPNPVAGIARTLNENSAFFRFVTGAVQGRVLSILCLLAVSAVVIFVLLPFMAELYVKSLNGFSDVKSKKITKEQAAQVLSKDVHSASLFKAFLWRDIKTVWREPTYFANGPLMVFLFPVIMIVSFLVGMISAGAGNAGDIINELRQTFAEITPEKLEGIKHYIILITAGATMFLGTCCNIASSSFSREGKDLYVLKALPVQPVIVAKVKFWHSFSYVLLSNVIFGLFLVGIKLFLGFPIQPAEFALMLVIIMAMSSSVSLSIIFVEMFIDTAHPKLNWENPVAAFKQNMNTMISMFCGMAIIAVSIVLGVFVLPKNQTGEIIFIAIFAALSAPIGAKYFKYAERKIPLL